MNNCVYCGKSISLDRIQALTMLGKQAYEFSCLECATKTDKKVKAIYLGPSGVSPMIFVDSVDNTPPIFDNPEEQLDFEKSFPKPEDF